MNENDCLYMLYTFTSHDIIDYTEKQKINIYIYCYVRSSSGTFKPHWRSLAGRNVPSRIFLIWNKFLRRTLTRTNSKEPHCCLFYLFLFFSLFSFSFCLSVSMSISVCLGERTNQHFCYVVVSDFRRQLLRVFLMMTQRHHINAGV